MAEISPYFKILNIAIFMLLSAVYVTKSYNGTGRYKKGNGILFFTLITIFSVYGFTNADYFGYKSTFDKIVLTGRQIHIEDIYYWLITDITTCYSIWRFIIWGSAAIILLMTFKRLNLTNSASFGAITLFYLTTFYIMRGSLGVSIMAYGMTFLLKPVSSKMLSYLTGILLIICSYFFHRSMLLSIALIPLAFFKLKKSYLLISLSLIPVLIAIISTFLNYLMDNQLSSENKDFSASATHYASVGMFEINVFGYIRNLFVYTPTYIALYVVMTKLYQSFPKYIRFFANYWYILVYIAVICSFQSTGGWFFSRFMYMSNLPFAIVMAYVFTNYKISNAIKTIIILGFIGNMYILLYSLYQSL